MAVRRVRRIIRRVDPWTVLKVAVVFNAVGALVFVLGTWVLWSLSLQRGIPDRIVEIFDRITLTLAIDGELYFRVIVLLAIVGAIVVTGLMTLGAVLYNLIADLVGGVEITVLEETYNPNPAGTRTVLRPVVRSQPGPDGQPPPGQSEVLAEEVAGEADAEPDDAGDDDVGSDDPLTQEPVPVPVGASDPSGNGSRAVGDEATGDADSTDRPRDPETADETADDAADPVRTA